MTHHLRLTVSSLLSVFFMTVHHADDIVRGMAPGGLVNLVVVIVLVGWTCATLVLVDRRSGHAIILVASLLASGIPVVHMMGPGLAGGRIAGAAGALVFVWTLIALGVSAATTAVLAASGLWSLRERQSRAV